MREIKFRAWDKENKEMVEVELLGKRVLLCKNGEWENIEDFEVMQFTGLCDKNNREIYEGDIAKSGKRLFVAKWNNDIASFVWEPLDGESSYPCFNVGTVKNVEVVGNIFENPELL